LVAWYEQKKDSPDFSKSLTGVGGSTSFGMPLYQIMFPV